MVLNASESWVSTTMNSSDRCHDNNTSRWEKDSEQMYMYFYLLLFLPGLFLNTIALWVLCRHISKKTKAVIFMINLAIADLAHILSLPLRIYYYFTHHWPFGRGVCLFCFYLKYLNMYAAIVFLVCISVQRCVFLLKPFSARRWRRRYDLLISFIVWVVVGVCCSPFILMRCFKDLPMRHVSQSTAVAMITFGELFGFLLPLLCISYSSFRIAHSLTQKQKSEKHRALKMVLSCSGLFLFCFGPYHVNFLLYLLMSQDILTDCVTVVAVRKFHPFSLCIASLSCCLNPILYYFLTTEFRMHFMQRTTSFSDTFLSSPLSSPKYNSVKMKEEI
uniref:G-protein coupled receptors family 1 profile domain-containing protein n=1 Tax=Periophthalmus magnuspinnatus TaxID=409849 RepID=A0A3B4AQQ0_9GOBI